MSNFYAVVTRQLEGHPVPVISTVIPTPTEPKDLERDYGNPVIATWIEHHFKDEAKEHKELFCSQLKEFRSAKWMLEVIEVPASFSNQLPRHVMSIEL